MTDTILLSLPEAAAVLGISKSRMYELVNDGRIATTQIDPGGDHFTSREALYDFVGELTFTKQARVKLRHRDHDSDRNRSGTHRNLRERSGLTPLPSVV